MWYKEWRQARFKILAAVASYGLISLYSIITWITEQYYNFSGLLDRWCGPALIATGALAALGGIDAVAEEKDRGTLSFLLTRPLKRTRIYAVKLMTNLGWLSAIYTIFSLIIFGLSRIKLTHLRVFYDPYYVEQYHEIPVTFNFSYIWPLSRSITVLLLILMIGIAITCYTAFISIFARTTIETIVFSVLLVLSSVILGVIVWVVVDNAFYGNSLILPPWVFEPSGMLLESGVLAFLALIFYRGGRAIFNRREF